MVTACIVKPRAAYSGTFHAYSFRVGEMQMGGEFFAPDNTGGGDYLKAQAPLPPAPQSELVAWWMIVLEDEVCFLKAWWLFDGVLETVS